MKFEERYQLQVPLTQSERGTVWKAHDAKLAREVAVAVVESDAPEALRTRFEEQTTKLVPLRHANVVRVFEAGKNDEGDPFASTEMVEGVSLESRMREGPPMRVDQAVRMIVDLLGALTTLHAAGVAHGDIEPGTIFVKEAGGRVTPKLVGFGLNRAEQRAGQLQMDEGHLRVLAFASPGQAKGQAVADAAGDVYSTAAVLFSLLTGRLPHRGADVEAMRASLSDRNVPAAGDVREEIAGPIADAIDAALAPEAKDRTEGADALAKALRGALIKMRNPGSIETVVGEREVAADATDDELSVKRAQPRQPKAPVSKPVFPSKAALPLKSGVPTPKKPAPPVMVAKPITDSVVEALPFERISGLFEDAKKPDTLEFEAVSGLLEIQSDAPPKAVPPTPAVKLPPPAPMPKEPESAKAKPADEEAIALVSEPPPPLINTQPSLFDDSPTEDAAPIEELIEAAPKPPAPRVAPPPPRSVEEPAESPGRFSSPDLDGEYAVPKSRIPVWVWAAGGAAALAMIAVGVYFAIDPDEPAVATTDNEPHEQPPLDEPDPPVVADPSTDEQPVAVADPEPAVEDPVPVPEPVVEPEPEPEPEPVVLTFRGVPEGASVTIDGEDVEGDRVELAPTEDERQVEVRLEGHRPWSRTVAGAESAELAVELARIPAPEPRPQPRVQPERRPQARVQPERRPQARVQPERRPQARVQPERRPQARPQQQTGRRRRGPIAATDPGF